jgi:hypothetical protein
MDNPGHYLRRIKNVALSIFCCTGPYTGVHCKLTLLKSSIRRVATDPGDYPRGDEDDRFIDYFGSNESIVTSSGQNDSGLFETNLHDERYLPFEGAGVISRWRLELPANPSAGDPQLFDYNSISDVIFHIRYTAREGGEQLRAAAKSHVKKLIKEGTAAGMTRLFSIRYEFPTEWSKFQNQKPVGNNGYELTVKMRAEHYPFWSKNYLREGEVTTIELFAQSTNDVASISVHDGADVDNEQTNFDDLEKKNPAMPDMFNGKLDKVDGLSTPTGELKLYFKDANITDLWLAISWTG